MSFGARRFTQLVYREANQVSWYEARFVPLAMGEADTYLTEEQLVRALDDNARRTPFPLPDAEEQLALKAFRAQARGKTASRAAVESVAARGQQRLIIDPLQPSERAFVERFRRGLLQPTDPERSQGSIAKWNDVEREILKILDLYFPKGTNPKGP